MPTKDAKGNAKNFAPEISFFNRNAAVNARGEFTLRNLKPNTYAFEVQLPGDTLYVDNITAPSQAARPPLTAANRAEGKSSTRQTSIVPINDFALKAGDNARDVEIILAEGAARIAGTAVTSSNEAAPTAPTSSISFSRLRVYLVPAEAVHADHAWRYHSTLATSDGRWTIANIAPGAYRLLALPADEELRTPNPRLLSHNSEGRARLRRDAETQGGV